MSLRAILTDIEGTTSSLAFVKEVLFPYARAQLPAFVREHAGEEQVQALLLDAAAEAGLTVDDLEALITAMQSWIDQDRKVTPLKSLQGLIWEAGYRNGDYHGHLYADAYDQLKAWHESGLRLYVFSSGSVYAQKLLFAHTEFGDLTPLFDGYFDTHIGNKREAEAYRRIVAEMGLDADEVLFLSDIVEELEAAREAGLRTCQLARPGETEADGRHPVASDFKHISIDNE